MTSTEAISFYCDIGLKIDTGEFEEALFAIQQKIDRGLSINEECRLHLLQSWIYYLYQYNPIAHSYINLVLKKRDTIDSYLVIEAYLIRCLLHLRVGKYRRCYDSIEECLKRDPNNSEAQKMLEILKLKTTID